jgi:hypothetical protein
MELYCSLILGYFFQLFSVGGTPPFLGIIYSCFYLLDYFSRLRQGGLSIETAGANETPLFGKNISNLRALDRVQEQCLAGSLTGEVAC